MAGSGEGVLEGLLGAGALLSLGVEIPEGEPVDAVTARVYRHPVLGHPVVRLSPSVLAPGDDLEMEHLGFEAPELGQEVAQRRRRGLGFPGWVLINDPARASLALEVAREMRRWAGVASVKIGAARKGFEDLAVRLGGSAPHFLPSFWEEVGRIFVRAGSARYGSEAFGKAREAERVHALEVDEASRLMAFVDFALDGALSSGALSDYARDLELRHPGPEAWGHFRALCVRRTLSGLPPWAGMGRDLKRMARAAGLNVEAEEHRFLLDVLESPALVRAPMQFWRDFRKPLVAMTAGSPAVRGHLLNLMPGPRQSASYHGEWLDMLEEFGALEAVIQPAERVAAGAEAAGGAAAWLERLMSHFTHTWWSSTSTPVQLFGLLRRMAPRLIAEATPIRFEDARWHWMDLDLLDLALELGVPVADPGPGAHLNLWRWFKHEADAERPRDPVSAAGDARFAAMFDRDMVKHFQDADFQKSIVGKAGFADAIRRWMSSNVRSLGYGTLSSAELSFNHLKSFARAEFWRDSPSAQSQVAEVQISRVLGRTLRGGIMDELGWPAFDEAAGDRKNLSIGGSFPNLVIWDGAAAEAIGPGGRVARVEMPVPASATVLRMRCVEGRVLMCWRDSRMGMEALWSGAGESPFFPQIYLWNLTIDDAMELPGGGGSFDGDRLLRAGDRELGSAHIGVKVLCDGESFWVMQPWGDDGAAFTEKEPATGKVGRQSRPAFIEGFLVEGEPLVKEVIRLQPLPEGLSGSPLGSSGGLVGWRARRSAALGGPVVAEGIDGRRREGALVDSGMLGSNSQEEVPFGLMSWPGDDRLRPISALWGMVKLWEPEGVDVLGRFEVVRGDESPFAAGSPRVLPPLWWHMLKPRDVVGSTALRSVSDEGAERLMAAGRAALEAAGGAVVKLDGVREAIGEVLPSVTNARLIAGIAGIVVHAARLERTLRELIPLWTSAQDDSPWGRVSHFLSQGADRPVVFKSGMLPWDMVGRVGAVAFKAVALGTGEEARAEALARLERWAASPLSDEGLAVRAFEAHLGGMKPAFAAPVEPEGEWGVEIDGRRYGLIVWEEWHPDRLRCKAIEVSTREPDDAGEGVFAPLPGSEITSVRAAGGWNGVERIGRLVALARERGPLPWSEATGAAIAARTGLSRAASALLWAGCPGLQTYSKNFLDKELREQLGLKVAEAATGRKELVECSTPDQRDQVWHEAMPLEVEALWSPLGDGADDPSSAVSRLCAAWNRVVGRRASVPEGLLQEAARGFQALYQAPTGILGWVAEPERAGVLNLDAEWRVTTQGRLQCRPPEAEGRMSPGHFEAPTLIAAVHYLPWLFVELPVGDPLRQNLVQVAERVWRRLNAPGLLFMAGSRYFHGESEGAQAFFEAFGGEPFELTDEGPSEDARGVDLGDRVITLIESKGAYNYSHVVIFFRPGRCADFAGLRGLLDDPYSAWNSGLDASELMRSAGMAALIERVRSTPVPEGQYEANPLWSAPEVVEAARRRLSLSEDGAVLYLQLLALAEPTAVNVLRWNGWQPDRAKAAAQELVGAALVLEAKRARAGRHTFLPGGWQVLKAPHLPIETWKLPLYGVERTADGMKMPLRRVLPLRPLHVIFKEAFKRVERGEGPRYDAL